MRGTSLGTGAKAEGWLIRDIGDFRLAAREAADGEEEMVLGEFWEESEAEGGLCSDRKSVEKEAWKSARCGGNNDQQHVQPWPRRHILIKNSTSDNNPPLGQQISVLLLHCLCMT